MNRELRKSIVKRIKNEMVENSSEKIFFDMRFIGDYFLFCKKPAYRECVEGFKVAYSVMKNELKRRKYLYC